jgi:uncharacterized protein (DUF488 family)
VTAPRLWTIGYEQATVAQVVGALAGAGIELLVDVRALPLSRRPGFSKTALAAAMREAGIGYRHMKALGTPAAGRAAARAGNHRELAEIYAGQLASPEALAAAAELIAVARERRVALLCYERDAANCHRSLLRQTMMPDFEAVNLTPHSPGTP